MSELLSYSSILLFASPICVLALRHSPALALVSVLATSGLLFIPVDHLTLILQLKGVFADLSLTTVILLIAWPLLSLNKRSSFFSDKLSNGADTAWLCSAILILAIALYPMALGAGPYDPYVLGYQPLALLTLIAALGIAAALKGYWISGAVVVLVLVAYWLKALPSQNFWDYLLDPIAVILAMSYLTANLVRRRKWHRSTGTPHSA